MQFKSTLKKGCTDSLLKYQQQLKMVTEYSDSLEGGSGMKGARKLCFNNNNQILISDEGGIHNE